MILIYVLRSDERSLYSLKKIDNLPKEKTCLATRNRATRRLKIRKL